MSVYRHAEFDDNSSNGGWVIAIFRFSKWRPRAILDFVVAQKWHPGTLRDAHGHQHIKFREDISNSGWIMAIFLFFQNGGRPPSWIWYRSKMTSQHVADCPYLTPCQIWWQYLKWRPSYCDFPFFKMAAGRHLGLAPPTFRTTHDGALAVLSVLSNFVLIWLIVSKILKIQFFLRLAWNRLSTPTFCWLYGVLIPWTIFFPSKPPKGTSLGEDASFQV